MNSTVPDFFFLFFFPFNVPAEMSKEIFQQLSKQATASKMCFEWGPTTTHKQRVEYGGPACRCA